MDDLMNLFVLENLVAAENQNFNNNARVQRDPFEELSEKKFMNMFRLSKELCLHLIHCLEPIMQPQGRNSDLEVKFKVLIALRFFASGSYQLDVASNKYLDVCQSTVSCCIRDVTEALNNPTVFNEWVKFPNNFQELNRIRTEFYRQHGFPGVIGCIDCTHIAIISPSSNDDEHPEHIYVNRKNYHSVNVQLICDANLKILNVNAKYPGSTNDAFIWGRSDVQRLLRQIHAQGHKDYYLLGDSGYPLRTWLLTPLENDPAPNTPEYRYNQAHKTTRVKIECCNGLLKARFRCLLKHRVLHYHPNVASKIINSCVVLHNMCLEYNVPEPDPEVEGQEIDWGMLVGDHFNVIEDDEAVAVRRVNVELAEGRAKRQRIIRQNFRI